jgi:hypothetical protein
MPEIKKIIVLNLKAFKIAFLFFDLPIPGITVNADSRHNQSK